MTDPLVSTYVDKALKQMKRRGLRIFAGDLSPSMRDSSIPPLGNSSGWKAVPSSVTDADLDALEIETGLGYPPLYRDFLKYLHFVELTSVGVDFERHLAADWHRTLRDLYFRAYDPERILGRGLLAFGRETFINAGLVCFDTRSRGGDGDCPVVFWDHEWIGDEQEIQPMFSSSARMFRCLALAADTDFDFVYHDENEDDPTRLLPRKQAVLRRFLDLDPEGAGGSARDYWTSWGVCPDS